VFENKLLRRTRSIRGLEKTA